VRRLRSILDIVAFALGPFLLVAFRPPQSSFEPFRLVDTFPIGNTWLIVPGDRCLFALGVTLVVMGVLAHLHPAPLFKPHGLVDATLIAVGVFMLASGLTAPPRASPFSETISAHTFTLILPGPRLLLAAGAGSLCLGLVRAQQRSKGLGPKEDDTNRPGPK